MPISSTKFNTEDLSLASSVTSNDLIEIRKYDSVNDSYESQKVSAAQVGKTYTAGAGISISGNNTISTLADLSINQKVGNDVNGFTLYRKAYSLSNVSGTTSVQLNLVGNANGIYLMTGFGKDSSNNIYPLTNNEKINITFTPTTAEITVETDLTLVLLNFVIEYYTPAAFLSKSADTSETGYIQDNTNPRYYSTVTSYFKDCFLAAYKGNYGSFEYTNPLVITLEPQTTVTRVPNAFNVPYDTNCTTEYTYNGYTIYYSRMNTAWYDDSNYIPKSVYESIFVNNSLTQFDTATNALKAFIDEYFS